MLTDTFKGEWKYLQKVVYDKAETQANRAVLELAMLLRILDDEEGFSKNEWKHFDECGHLHLKKGEVQDIGARQIANKIIHAKSLEWRGEDKQVNLGPILIAYGRDEEKWEKAEIQIFSLAAICGQLMS